MQNEVTQEPVIELSPRERLIEGLNSKSVRLSYSTLKHFNSPINLINYKLKEFKPNDSITFGSVCDCLLLTPDDFDNKFKVINSVPSTDNQIGFADALIQLSKYNGYDNIMIELSNEIIENEFKKFYKRGDALKTFDSLKEYIEGSVKGKTLITPEMKAEADDVCNNLLDQDDVQILFSQITEVQKKVEWKENGWDFIGYLDILMPGRIVDLKFSKDANPERFERDIANLDYFLQAAMYCHAVKELGIEEHPSYSFLVFDKSKNYSIIDLDYSYIAYGMKKYKYLIQQLDRCISENAWEDSFNFFKRIYTVYKPKWIKGFELSNDED